MCGKGRTTQQTTSTYGPPAEVMSRYRDLLDRAENVSETPYSGYTGDRVAGFTPDQQSAFAGVRDSVGLAQPYVQEAAGLARAGAAPISADAISRYTNPFTQQVVDATTADFDAQNKRQLSQVAGQAAMSGAYGDSAAVAKALAAESQQRVQAPILAGLRSQGFQQSLSAAQGDAARSLQGAGVVGGLGQLAQNQQLQGLGALMQSGGLQQALGQQELNVPYSDFLEQRAYPFQTAQWLAGIQGAIAPGMGGTQTTTQPGTNSNNALAGLLTTGLGLAGNFFLPGVGGAIGGGLGNAIGSSLAHGGRVGYADGGAVSGIPYGSAATPFATAHSVIPVTQLRPMQLQRPQMPVPVGQPPDGDTGVGQLTSGLADLTRQFRGILREGRQNDSRSSDPWAAVVTPEGYADGGVVVPPQFAIPAIPDTATAFTPGPSVLGLPQGVMVPGLADRASQFSPGPAVVPAGVGNPGRSGTVVPASRPPTGLVPQSAARPPPAAEPQPQEAPPPQGQAAEGVGGFASSPWGALTTAGLAMMASKSPTLAGAVGEGGLVGMKHLQQIEQQRLNARRVDMEAQRLAAAAQREQQRLGMEERRLAVAERTAEQGRFTFAPSGDGKGVLALNTRDGTVKQVDGATMGQRTGAGQQRQSVFEVKRQAYLAANPGKEQEALEFAAGRRTVPQQQMTHWALTAAQKEATDSGIIGKERPAFVQRRAAELRQLYEAASQPQPPPAAPAASPASPPSATPPAATPPTGQPAAAGVPPSLEALSKAGRLARSPSTGYYMDTQTKRVYTPDGKPVE